MTIYLSELHTFYKTTKADVQTSNEPSWYLYQFSQISVYEVRADVKTLQNPYRMSLLQVSVKADVVCPASF